MARSDSSHLLRKDSLNATRMLSKIKAFSAHEITVRGDITVEISPARKAARVRPASATILRMFSRPAASANAGTRATTMSISVASGR